MPLPTRWIICTVWAVPDAEAMNKVARQQALLPNISKEPLKHPDMIYKYFWTPIGTQSGLPVSFVSEDEALNKLKELVNHEPSLARQNLKFSLLEVKYVPNKVRSYKQDWHDKYVVKESGLEFKDHKFTDIMK